MAVRARRCNALLLLLPLCGGAAGATTETTILLMGGMEHMKMSNKVWELELGRIETIDFEESGDLPQLEMSDEGKWEPVDEGDGDDGDQGGASHEEL